MVRLRTLFCMSTALDVTTHTVAAGCPHAPNARVVACGRKVLQPRIGTTRSITQLHRCSTSIQV
ncbi:hypothetical protein OZ10_00985 [Xanthomonas cannabis pv. cannabis]|nr:hypothetical protein OZ10_00985 [Xanthomonas cannabis pv. cannabis]